MRLWGNNADHGTKRKRTLAVRRGFAPRVSRSRSSQGPRAGRARDGDRVVQGGAFRPAATCSGPSGEAVQTGGLRPALRDSSARPGRARADNVRLSPGPRRRPSLVCGAPGPRAETKQCVTGSGTHHGLFAVPVSEEREAMPPATQTAQRRVYGVLGANGASFIPRAWGHGPKRTLSWLGQGSTWLRPHTATLRPVQKRKPPWPCPALARAGTRARPPTSALPPSIPGERLVGQTPNARASIYF